MEEKLLDIKYDMTLGEIEEGFRLFQKKYQMKRVIIWTIVYAIALFLGVDFIIRDYTQIYGYILAGISAGMLFYSFYKPVLIRRKMISTISSLAEESYEAEFYKSQIRITTIISTEEKINGEEITEAAEQPEDVVTKLFFGSDLLEAMENEKMFLLFVNKGLIYIFSKRCLSEEEQEKLRSILTDKAIL